MNLTIPRSHATIRAVVVNTRSVETAHGNPLGDRPPQRSSRVVSALVREQHGGLRELYREAYGTPRQLERECYRVPR